MGRNQNSNRGLGEKLRNFVFASPPTTEPPTLVQRGAVKSQKIKKHLPPIIRAEDPMSHVQYNIYKKGVRNATSVHRTSTLPPKLIPAPRVSVLSAGQQSRPSQRVSTVSYNSVASSAYPQSGQPLPKMSTISYNPMTISDAPGPSHQQSNVLMPPISEPPEYRTLDPIADQSPSRKTSNISNVHLGDQRDGYVINPLVPQPVNQSAGNYIMSASTLPQEPIRKHSASVDVAQPLYMNQHRNGVYEMNQVMNGSSIIQPLDNMTTGVTVTQGPLERQFSSMAMNGHVEEHVSRKISTQSNSTIGLFSWPLGHIVRTSHSLKNLVITDTCVFAIFQSMSMKLVRETWRSASLGHLDKISRTMSAKWVQVVSKSATPQWRVAFTELMSLSTEIMSKVSFLNLTLYQFYMHAYWHPIHYHFLLAIQEAPSSSMWPMPPNWLPLVTAWASCHATNPPCSTLMLLGLAVMTLKWRS